MVNNLGFNNNSGNKKAEKGTLACCSDSDEYSDSAKACINNAMSILVYANNTEKKLREKLTYKGHSKENIDTAIDYVKGKGYIDENAQILDAAEVLASAKLYGKKRIAMELYKKGFRRDAISAINYDELGIDFVAGCAAMICRVCRLSEDDEKRQFSPDDRLMGSLIRYGYSIGEIREAVRLLHET